MANNLPQNDTEMTDVAKIRSTSESSMGPPKNQTVTEKSTYISKSKLKTNKRSKSEKDNNSRGESECSGYELDNDNIKPNRKNSLKELATANANLTMEVEKCNQKIADQNSYISELANQITKFTERLAKLEKSATTIGSNTSRPLFSSLFNSSKPSPPTENERNILNAVLIEQKDQTRRDKSLLIMGVEMTEDLNEETRIKKDKEKVYEIFNKIQIDCDKIDSIYRFPKKTSSPYPAIIKIQLKDKTDRLDILKASRILKTSDSAYSKVYINPDLTINQRQAEIELIKKRNELNQSKNTSSSTDKNTYYWGIRSGVLKKISISQAPSNQVNSAIVV